MPTLVGGFRGASEGWPLPGRPARVAVVGIPDGTHDRASCVPDCAEEPTQHIQHQPDQSRQDPSTRGNRPDQGQRRQHQQDLRAHQIERVDAQRWVRPQDDATPGTPCLRLALVCRTQGKALAGGTTERAGEGQKARHGNSNTNEQVSN